MSIRYLVAMSTDTNVPDLAQHCWRWNQDAEPTPDKLVQELKDFVALRAKQCPLKYSGRPTEVMAVTIFAGNMDSFGITLPTHVGQLGLDDASLRKAFETKLREAREGL